MWRLLLTGSCGLHLQKLSYSRSLARSSNKLEVVKTVKKQRFSTNKSLYLGNGTRCVHSYNGMLIGSRTWAFVWYQFCWPWMTSEGHITADPCTDWSLRGKLQLVRHCMCVCVSSSVSQQEVKVIWQKAPHGGPIPRLGVTPGARKLYHWIPGVGFPISVPC